MPQAAIRLAAVSLPQILLVLIVLQGFYIAFYPTHIGHDAPYWFIGPSTGWLLGRYLRGHEEVHLPGLDIGTSLYWRRFNRCQFCVDVMTRLPRALADDNALVQYGFGTLSSFGLAIVALLPFLIAKAHQFFRSLQPQV